MHFLLITGYFMINSQVTKLKLFKLWFQVWTYSILSVIIYYVVTGDTHTRHIFTAFTPISHNIYWFFTSYLVVFCLSPILNVGIKSIKRIDFSLIILFMLFFFCILPTRGHWFLTDNNRIGLFLTLYFIGAWIRLYLLQFFKPKTILVFSSLGTLFGFGLAEISILTNGWSDDLGMRYRYVWGMEQFPVVFMAISSFILFSQLKIKSNKIINVIASTVFGIYLIHMNGYTTNMIWHDIFGIKEWYYDKNMPSYLLLTSLCLFFICSLIEYIRITYIESPTLTKVKKYLGTV